MIIRYVDIIRRYETSRGVGCLVCGGGLHVHPISTGLVFTETCRCCDCGTFWRETVDSTAGTIAIEYVRLGTKTPQDRPLIECDGWLYEQHPMQDTPP